MIHSISRFQKTHGAQRSCRGSGGSGLLSCASSTEHLEEQRNYGCRMAAECSVLPSRKGKNPLDTNLYKRWIFLLVLEYVMEVFERDSCHVQNQGPVGKLLSVEIFGLFNFSAYRPDGFLRPTNGLRILKRKNRRYVSSCW